MASIATRKITVDEYHDMIEQGVFAADDHRYELLEGEIVEKMSKGIAHDGTIQIVLDALTLPRGWCPRTQSAITLSDSEPEPDVVIARGNSRTYVNTHHPYAADIGLIVEIAMSSLDLDREDKGRIYARERIVEYWIVNLVEEQIEVYTQPSGPGLAPAYASRNDYPRGSDVPLTLDGKLIASISVNDLLP